MVNYNIVFKKTAQKELVGLPKQDVARIVKRIKELSANPRLNGAEKLSGEEKYRIRQGNYRILYSIDDKNSTIMIVKIAHRKEVYRLL